MMRPNISIPSLFDGVCSNEECQKVIFRGTEDAISFFNSDLCKVCETEMFRYMEGYDAKNSVARRIMKAILPQ